jgi:hypothetical protein
MHGWFSLFLYHIIKQNQGQSQSQSQSQNVVWYLWEYTNNYAIITSFSIADHYFSWHISFFGVSMKMVLRAEISGSYSVLISARTTYYLRQFASSMNCHHFAQDNATELNNKKKKETYYTRNAYSMWKLTIVRASKTCNSSIVNFFAIQAWLKTGIVHAYLTFITNPMSYANPSRLSTWNINEGLYFFSFTILLFLKILSLFYRHCIIFTNIVKETIYHCFKPLDLKDIFGILVGIDWYLLLNFVLIKVSG